MTNPPSEPREEGEERLYNGSTLDQLERHASKSGLHTTLVVIKHFRETLGELTEARQALERAEEDVTFFRNAYEAAKDAIDLVVQDAKAEVTDLQSQLSSLRAALTDLVEGVDFAGYAALASRDLRARHDRAKAAIRALPTSPPEEA